MSGAECAPLRINDLYYRSRRCVIALDDVACEDPGMTGGYTVGSLAVDFDFRQRIACRRAIRSSVEGCVEKSRISAWPLNGLTMNRCCVAGEASMGIRLE